jgi:predicted transcriptional regulator
MKLVQPTDFEILKALSETGGRNVATNIAQRINKDRSYVNTRFSALVENGLVERVGPSEKSGLYDLTDRGNRALQYRDRYEKTDDFESLISDENSSMSRGESD